MSQRGSRWLQAVPPRLQERVRLTCFPHGGGGALAYRNWAGTGSILLFSSLAAILGGLGMAGYAAANRCLNAAVAGCRDTGDVPRVSVNFDDWDFEYTKEQVGFFAHTRRGLTLPPEEGVVAIEAILGEPDLSQVVLSATPLNQRLTKLTWLRDDAFEAVHERSVTDAVKCEKPDRTVQEGAT